MDSVTSYEGVTVPVEEIASRYMEAIRAGNGKQMYRILRVYNSLIDDARSLSPEVFDLAVLPLLVHDEELRTAEVFGVRSMAREAQTPLISALLHDDCPPYILHLAARGPNSRYRFWAALHPNCPEEDTVYVALLDGGV